MKLVEWLGDSRDAVSEFPPVIRQELGYQVWRVQDGLEPSDWKPMESVGSGVREIRVRDASGVYRVLYVAKFAETIYVLHAFQKKTQRTAKRDIDLATVRYKELAKGYRK